MKNAKKTCSIVILNQRKVPVNLVYNMIYFERKNFLLVWEDPFSEIGKIKGLLTTSERVARLRWIDRSKVSRNQHKKLVLTYLVFPYYNTDLNYLVKQH